MKKTIQLKEEYILCDLHLLTDIVKLVIQNDYDVTLSGTTANSIINLIGAHAKPLTEVEIESDDENAFDEIEKIIESYYGKKQDG